MSKPYQTIIKLSRILPVILLCLSVLSLTGCIPFSRRPRISAQQIMLNELEAKYGENFVIYKFDRSSGGSMGVLSFTPKGGDFYGVCAPEADPSMRFLVNLLFYLDENRSPEDIRINDKYIEAVLGRQMECLADSILSERYENFRTCVYVDSYRETWSAANTYGIESEKETISRDELLALEKFTEPDKITIEQYSERYPGLCCAEIILVIDVEEKDKYGELPEMLQRISESITGFDLKIECFFADKSDIEYVSEAISENNFGTSYHAWYYSYDISDIYWYLKDKYTVYYFFKENNEFEYSHSYGKEPGEDDIFSEFKNST